MKDFFAKFWWILLSIIMIILLIGGFTVGIWAMFQQIWEFIIKIGNGSWIKGLIFLPFLIIGIIQVARGLFSVAGKDEDLFDFDNHPYRMILYLIITIFSCYVIVNTLQNLG
jgi:hypothetical protein